MSGLDSLEGLLGGSEDADDALRQTVARLAVEPGVSWAGVAFSDAGTLTLGPSAGEPDPERRLRSPVLFQGETVGELWVDGELDPAVLERVASLIAAHVLIGWDTGGEAWDP